VAFAGLLLGQRPKPVYDPETKEGLLIQHIAQEKDPVEKLHYMEQFVLQFPQNEAIAWVYDQMQPAYLDLKAWDEAMRIGEKRIALEPQNLDAVKLSLKAADSKGDAKDIASWADTAWKLSSGIVAKGGPNAADAEQVQLYAEYSLYSAAEQTADLAARLDTLKTLQQRNPKSPYAEHIPAECFALYRMLNQMDKALAFADQMLAIDPNNVDLLMAVAEYHFGREEARDQVILFATRMIDQLAKKTKPANLTDEDWAKKKRLLLGAAYYMGGVSSTVAGQYGRADQMLRAALPLIAGEPNQQATAFYQLGVANYHLADKDAARAKDALAYWRQCASIKSSFQAQAMKNVDSVRNEFNLP
jgi:tetratricopeptide (TPR) repeat protein